MADGSIPIRLQTGIPGLDRVLGGGLPPRGVYMVEGPPGSGKTILGNQLCYHHAEQGSPAVYLTLLSESHTQMFAHLRGLQFFRADLVAERVHYVSGFKALENEGLNGLSRMIREALIARRATLLVLDGLVSASESSTSSRDYKKFLHELQILAAMTECTVVLLSSTDYSSSTRPEHTMVDGIIELSEDRNDLRSLRHLRVRKLRGTDPVRGRHTLVISDAGISVRARIEAELLRLREDAPLVPGTQRIDFGIARLDDMLAGGLPAHSNTMLIGPSGSGKTILGLQFLAAGAKKGELGVYFGFYERPQALLLKADRVGLGLSPLHERGLIHLFWEPFGEGSIDILGDRLLSVIREHRPARLFLDGMQGFQQAVDTPERVGGFFSALADDLEARNVTTLYTVESPDLFGPVITSPVRGLSAVTHNIILLRYTELDATICRLISVLKLRDGAHDTAIRELRVTESGVVITDSFERASGVLSGAVRRAESPPRRAPSSPGTYPRKHDRHTDHGERATILIVDDEFGLADVIAEILGERGYRTDIAINGELGLRALRENEPDLLILDVMMPVMSGTEMLKQMKADPALSNIPVVLMTALPEAVSGEVRALSEAVLQKPFGPDQLFEVLERQLSAKRKSA
jgi:circadian clock protein KaiC